MPTLNEMSAAGRSDVLPGFVLSPPRLREWGDAEQEAASSYLRIVRQACAGMPPEVQAVLMQGALDLVAAGEFGMGMPKLDAFLRSATAAPFVAWLCLRVKHEQITREKVPGMYLPAMDDAGAREEEVSRAVLELWGFLPQGSKKNEASNPSPPPSTGPESSPSSESTEGFPETKSST